MVRNPDPSSSAGANSLHATPGCFLGGDYEIQLVDDAFDKWQRISYG
jgi:hypothetical protein